jgi:hypothetical protein
MMTRYLTNTPSVPTPTPQPKPDPFGEYQVYVTSKNGKGVNLRSGPAKTFSSIGFYSVGTPAAMITKGKTWSYIRIGNRYGYMMTQFIDIQGEVVPGEDPADQSKEDEPGADGDIGDKVELTFSYETMANAYPFLRALCDQIEKKVGRG